MPRSYVVVSFRALYGTFVGILEWHFRWISLKINSSLGGSKSLVLLAARRSCSRHHESWVPIPEFSPSFQVECHEEWLFAACFSEVSIGIYHAFRLDYKTSLYRLYWPPCARWSLNNELAIELLLMYVCPLCGLDIQPNGAVPWPKKLQIPLCRNAWAHLCTPSNFVPLRDFLWHLSWNELHHVLGAMLICHY